MYYIGIDLHKQDLVMAIEDEHGPVGRPRRLACRDVAAIRVAVARKLAGICWVRLRAWQRACAAA